MYLALKKIKGQNCYFIRESYPHDGHYLSRDLIDLGPDPARFIVYPGGNSFYIDQIVEKRINGLGKTADPDVLEDIFWRFLRPDIKRALAHFRSRDKRYRADRGKKRPPEGPDAGLHLFDRRRVHFLRFGHTDQRNIVRLPPKMFHMLLNKSRDEIEQMFIEMEGELAVREYKTYAYVIFDLQKFFHESFARNHPQMLDQTEVDAHFIERVCRLSVDPLFLAGIPSGDRLNEYLVRYVLMYFDHDYGPGSSMDEYLRQFINSRRDYRPPDRKREFSFQEASAIFGQSKAELRKMSTRELARQYRQKAQELHPDKGGDQDDFVKLTEAYHELLRAKK